MNIKDFVSETLKEIASGVKEAQKDNCVVVVRYASGTIREVEFDIAVTAVEETGTSGKVGISVWSIGAGMSGKTESSSSVVSRIKFGVPLQLPTGN